MTKRNILTFAKRFELAQWLREPGRLSQTSQRELLAQASEALQVELTWSHIQYILNELNLSFTAPKPDREVLKAQAARIDSLETRVKYLEESLRVLKGFYVNSTKTPKEAKNGNNLDL